MRTFILQFCLACSFVQTVGGATIGIDLQSHPRGLITVNENQVNFSVILRLSELVRNNEVNVSCTQISVTTGVSRVHFSNVISPIGSQAVLLNASVVSPGRVSQAQCRGQSLNGGNQYHLLNSSGGIFQVHIVRGPTASICQSTIVVKGYVTTQQVFTVRLSETVINFPVFVDCKAANTSTGSQNMVLAINRATVGVSQNEVQVPFRVVSTGDPVLVSCTAVSSNCASSVQPSISSSILFSSSSNQSTVFTPQPNITSILNGTSSMAKAINSSTLRSQSNISNVVQTTGTVSSLSLFANTASVSANISSVSSQNTTTNSSLLKTINGTVNPSTLAATNVSSLVGSLVTRSIVVSVTPIAPMIPLSPSNASQCQYRSSTSQGPGVTFNMEQPTIQAIPPSDKLTSMAEHVTLVSLDQPLPNTETLELNCRLRPITTSQITVSNFCNDSTGVPLHGSTEVLLGDTMIKILQPKISFKTSELFKNITIQLSNVGNVTDPRLLQTLCCSTSSQKYSGKTVHVLLWVNLRGTRKFDWISVPTSGSATITSLDNVDTSCPCNLYDKLCDENCCCDKDCSATEINAFTCIGGFFGGRPTSKSENDCDAVWPDSTDVQPIVCVFTNNSPFLGYFYPYTKPPTVSDVVPFETLLRSRTTYSYDESENRGRRVANVVGYLYGSPIKTTVGILSLPGTSIGAACLLKDVRFLLDGTDTCKHAALESLCFSYQLDASNYITSSSLVYPSCPTNPGILAENSGSERASVTVEYYCADNPSSYIISNEGTAITSATSLLVNDTRQPSPRVVRCDFDDGRTAAPKPNFNRVNNSCNNAVVDVNYLMLWNATKLKDVSVRITLGIVPLLTTKLSTFSYTIRYTTSFLASTVIPTPSSYSSFVTMNQSRSVNSSRLPTPTLAVSSVAQPIPQRFSTIVAINTSFVTRNVTVAPTLVQGFTVSFQYVSVSPSSSTRNLQALSASSSTSANSNTASIRSGNPGYIRGRQLLSQTNSEVTAGTFSANGISIWKAKMDGTCSRFEKCHVPFGRDVVSGCNIRISLDEMKDCSVLRNSIMAAQQELTNATRVAKRGNPSAAISSDWLSIVRIQPNLTVSRKEALGECLSIPAHVRIEVLTAEAGKYAGQSQREVSGVRITYVLEQWKFSCASGKLSACFERDNATQQGLSPQYQEFSLTTSVRFIRIPVKEPPPIKSSSKLHTVCKYDSCLKELLYPFQSLYGVSISFVSDIHPTAAMLPFGLVTALVAIGTITISKRWIQ